MDVTRSILAGKFDEHIRMTMNARDVADDLNLVVELLATVLTLLRLGIRSPVFFSVMRMRPYGNSRPRAGYETSISPLTFKTTLKSHRRDA